MVTPPFDDRWGWKTPPGVVIGDAWHRFMVRMLEVVESIHLCEQALDRYPSVGGSTLRRVSRATRAVLGEAYVETECPRGQMGFYVVGGPGKSMVPLCGGRQRGRRASAT